MQAGLEKQKSQKAWQSAAQIASNLSELYLTSGDLPQALAYAEQSVQLADRSGDAFSRMGFRTTLADALHQAGHLTEAGATFYEAENMQKKYQPKLPLLYSVQGHRYCDLLLSQGDYAEVERRASQTLEWAKVGRASLLSMSLEILSLARAHLLKSHRDPNTLITNSLDFLNRAVDGLRQAGTQHHIPSGLLARAEYYRLTGDWNKAKRDLDEAFTIAARGGMGLHLADCHLEYARLYLAKGDKEKAREHWQIAKDSIEKMGYHRRDKEVQELEEQLK
jgi:tetratricopeptide (TPR) repeat protein